MEYYYNFIQKHILKIQQRNVNSYFMCFNKKIDIMLKKMKKINLIKRNDNKIIDFLNNKFKIRDCIKKDVPILDYI